jgi:hypothetical protein
MPFSKTMPQPSRSTWIDYLPMASNNQVPHVMLNQFRSRWSARLKACVFGATAWLGANAALAASAPTEWCGTSTTEGVVYFDYCGVYAAWHFDRFDLTTGQWLTPIPVGSHTSFTVGAPGLLVASFSGLMRYELDGSNPSNLPNALTGATSIALGGPYLFMGNYNEIQSYDLISQQQVSSSYSSFGYFNPNPFIVDSTHNQLLGLTGIVFPESPVLLSYDENGVLQTAPSNNRFALPFTSGPRNYLAPDSATFANSGGAVFTTDISLNEAAWLGGPFDDMVFAGSDIVLLRYDTLVRIDRSSYQELGRLTLDHTYSDLALDGTNVVAFYSEHGVPHSFSVPIASIVPQTLPLPVSPTAHPFAASKVQLDLSGILYLLVGSDSVIHRYSLSTNAFLPSIELPEMANTFAVDQVTGRAFVGLGSPAIDTVDPGATNAHAFVYSRQPMDEMTIISGRLYASEPDDNWDVHEVRDESTGAILNSIDLRNPTTELVWSPVNRSVYYVSQNQTPENVYWDVVDSTGTITSGNESSYFGSPLNALPPVRPDPTGTFLVLGSGQTMNTSTMLLRTQSLPDAPVDVAWIGNAMYAAVANGSSSTALRRYGTNLAVSATAYALGVPQRLLEYNNTLVLISQWNGGTLITRIAADFSGSDFSVAALASSPAAVQSGQQASAMFEFRNQGPAGPTSAHLTISPNVSVGPITWNCQTSTTSFACGNATSFDSIQSMAAGEWLRVTGTFTATSAMAGEVTITANASAGGADPVTGNNTDAMIVLFDELFKGTFD